MSEDKTAQRVLIVDDEVDLLGVLRDLFLLFGYEVLTAANGQLACAILDQNTIDVVLTDVRMPVMDGIELVRQIRSRDRLKPIVMVTSGYSDHLPEVVYDAGANGFLPKPFGASGVRDAFVQAGASPERRWAQARTGGIPFQLRKHVDAGEAPGQLNLGTGGFFWALEGSAPSVGQAVDFVVTRARGVEWRGQGIVRWTRGGPGAGCGIEISYLDDACRSEIITLIDQKKPTAFIPRD